MTTNSSHNNKTTTRTVATDSHGVLTIESGIPAPCERVKRSKYSGKYAEISGVLDTLKVGESFVLTFGDTADANRMLAHISLFGKKRKRTFMSRRAFKNPLRRRVWRTEYRKPATRKRQEPASPKP